jgi:hypothetical protein
VRYGTSVETENGPQVFAADGSMWVADPTFVPLTIADERLTCDTEPFGQMKAALDQLRGVLFAVPQDLQRRDRLIDRIVGSDSTTDVVILDNGDVLRGLLLGLADDRLSFQTNEARLEIETGRITALIFNPKLVKKPPSADLRMVAGFRDGSRLVAGSWRPGLRGVAFLTVGGLEVAAESSQLVSLQPLGGAVTYLSDLPIANYRHRPYLSIDWPCKLDRNVTGGRLRCGGQPYDKGLGLHSVAVLTYRLDGDYRRFEAELGIDDSTKGRGSVEVRIYADDGSGKWQPKLTSKTIRGGDRPEPIAVDVRDAKRLSIIVDLADRGDELDHANLLDARLIR